MNVVKIVVKGMYPSFKTSCECLAITPKDLRSGLASNSSTAFAVGDEADSIWSCDRVVSSSTFSNCASL